MLYQLLPLMNKLMKGFLVLRMTIALALVLLLVGGAQGGDPVFDPSTLMRLVLVPSDAAVGSVIYRVRASDPDFDYPLHFELIGKCPTSHIQNPKEGTLLLTYAIDSTTKTIKEASKYYFCLVA